MRFFYLRTFSSEVRVITLKPFRSSLSKYLWDNMFFGWNLGDNNLWLRSGIRDLRLFLLILVLFGGIW